MLSFLGNGDLAHSQITCTRHKRRQNGFKIHIHNFESITISLAKTNHPVNIVTDNGIVLDINKRGNLRIRGQVKCSIGRFQFRQINFLDRFIGAKPDSLQIRLQSLFVGLLDKFGHLCAQLLAFFILGERKGIIRLFQELIYSFHSFMIFY